MLGAAHGNREWLDREFRIVAAGVAIMLDH
jgi:hypothetical protein